MDVLRLASSTFAVAGPIVAWCAGVHGLRRALFQEGTWRRHVVWAIVTFFLGAALFAPAWRAEPWIRALAGIPDAPKATDLGALVCAFLVVAPLEQGLKVAAIVPAWRARALEHRASGMLYGATAALGFVSAHNAVLLATGGGGMLDVARALLAVPAHVFFAGAWGYALGRAARRHAMTDAKPRRLGGRAFNTTWLAATLFNGAYDNIVFERGPLALLATPPILVAMGFVTYVALRDTRSSAEAPATPTVGKQRPRTQLVPPSLATVRVALSHTERPVKMRWIAAGAFVTAGVMIAMVACAVVLGRRAGLDFGSVDRADAAVAATAPPVILVGSAALAAFPLAGYLVARASAPQSLLEPALAASLAIAACLVLLGLAAPIALVFALAFTPIAFALACAGAWFGVE